MSRKRLNSPRLLRRPRPKIEPIHVEELLGGAGMSGFLGVLEAPASTPHLQELVHEVRPAVRVPGPRKQILSFAEIPPRRLPIDPDPVPQVLVYAPVHTLQSGLSSRVASTIDKLKALTHLMDSATTDS